MIDIEGIKARLDIAESGIKCAEQAIENAKACFDKAKEMLDAKDAKPPRNWPERIEAGMQVADCMICGIHPYSFRSGEWARLAGVAMVTPKDAEPRLAYVAIFDDGVVDYIAVSDGMNISIKARDILTIRTDAHEPTGAELVGRVCEFSDDGENWTDGARPREQGDPRICIGYDEKSDRPYSNKWAEWKLARLTK